VAYKNDSRWWLSGLLFHETKPFRTPSSRWLLRTHRLSRSGSSRQRRQRSAATVPPTSRCHNDYRVRCTDSAPSSVLLLFFNSTPEQCGRRASVLVNRCRLLLQLPRSCHCHCYVNPFYRQFGTAVLVLSYSRGLPKLFRKSRNFAHHPTRQPIGLQLHRV